MEYDMIKLMLLIIILIGNNTILIQAENCPISNIKLSECSNSFESIYPDTLILFEQNYSDIRMAPSNIFLINWVPETEEIQILETIYNNIYGKNKYNLDYNPRSLGIEYVANRNLTIFDNYPISNFIDILSQWDTSSLKKLQDQISNPCYVSGLVPMTRCSYKMTLGFAADDPKSFTEIMIPGSRIRFQLLNNRTIQLATGYIAPNGTYIDKKLLIHENTNKCTFYIKYDGINKTNSLIYNKTCYIVTPFYDYQRRSLPYPDISNSWIKLTNYLLGNGTYLKVKVYDISQITERKSITPIGYAGAIPFGLDGPHPPNTIEKGIELLKKNGGTGTIWFDIESLNSYNDSQISYLRDLVHNKSWECGIHFSKELNKLTLNDAHNLMKEEYDLVKNKIGCKPITWCSLRNSDNINHSIFAYNEFGMIWRNGESGVHAEKLGGIGNLDDFTWQWWKLLSRAGMIHPVFTHRTDEQPAEQWSISYTNFTEWQNNYEKLHINTMPFGKWWKINSNTYDASFENITSKENTVMFTAKTNGYDSLINIKIKPNDTAEIYDLTAQKNVSWELYQDGSIIFWVEDGHNYSVSNMSLQ
jgi:hypothetical protein